MGVKCPPCRAAPPVFEEARYESVAVPLPLQVPVVFEQEKHVLDRHRIAPALAPLLELAIPVDDITPQPAATDRGFGQDLQGGAIPLPSQHHLQPALVVLQVHLSADAEHLGGVHALHVFHRGFFPAGAAQVLVEVVEELLHVVGDLTPQPAAHLPADGEGKVEAVGLRQGREAGGRGLVVPGLQIEGRVDVRVGAEPGLCQDRLQAHAAGEDQANAASMCLAVLAEPAQELIRRPPPLRGDAVVSPLEQPVDQNRQLVDCEHHGPVAFGQSGEDLVPLLPPVPGVDPRPELDLDLVDGHRIDSIADLSQGAGESRLDPRPGALHRPRPSPDLGDGVRRGGGVLQVDEDRLEAALFVQAPQQLPNQAGLAHPPLRGQQGMGAVPDPLDEGLELHLPVEEPIPLDPVGSGFLEHHSRALSQRIRWQRMCWHSGGVSRGGRSQGKRATGNHPGIRAPFPGTRRIRWRDVSAEGAVRLCVMANASARDPPGPYVTPLPRGLALRLRRGPRRGNRRQPCPSR